MDKAIHATPAGQCVHYQRRRPEETILYQLAQEHVQTVLQVTHRATTTFLIKQEGQKRAQATIGAVALTQRFGDKRSHATLYSLISYL